MAKARRGSRTAMTTPTRTEPAAGRYDGLILLMLCVNDYRSGRFRGLCRQLAVDEVLTLESPWADRHLRWG